MDTIPAGQLALDNARAAGGLNQSKNASNPTHRLGVEKINATFLTSKWTQEKPFSSFIQLFQLIIIKRVLSILNP
jgi:hypothetical protein